MVPITIEPQSQTVDDINNNIVKIINDEGNFKGTGFFIEVDKEKYCITCHHCIYDLDNIFIQRFNTKFLSEWREDYSDPHLDIAVLKVKNVPFKPLLYAREAMANFEVSIRGFSGTKLKSLPEGTSGRYSRLSDSAQPFEVDPKNISGKNKWNVKPAVYVNVYECEGQFEFGFSGGPVCFKGPNKVVGIFTAKDDEYGYVIPIQTLLSKFEIKVINKEKKESDEIPIREIPIDEISIAHSNKNIKEILQKGNHYFENKEWNQAISIYHEIVKDPNYLNALCYIGRAHANIARYSNIMKERLVAVKYFDVVLALEPNNIYALNGKGYALNGLKKYKMAIKWFDEALKINPNYVTALFNKGFAYHNLNHKKKAIECYSKVLEFDPNHFYANKFKNDLESNT